MGDALMETDLDDCIALGDYHFTSIELSDSLVE